MVHRSRKTYGTERGLSCALRQWAADSHCALLHGYSLGFRFTFAAEQLDRCGWVVDFGKAGFGQIRDWLHATFDHTLLVAQDDPARSDFARLSELGVADIRLVPANSCEALAEYVYEHAAKIIEAATKGRCWIVEVECFEHGANSAVFRSLEAVERELTAAELRVALSIPDAPQAAQVSVAVAT